MGFMFLMQNIYYYLIIKEADELGTYLLFHDKENIKALFIQYQLMVMTKQNIIINVL